MAGLKQRISAFKAGLHGALLVPAALMLAVIATTTGVGTVSDGSFLKAFVSTAASVLLIGVAVASVQTGHRWREWTRHDSIRADIAAAGGLGRRLMI